MRQASILSVGGSGDVAKRCGIGDEVVQLYLQALDSKLPAPLSQLIGFQRIHLAPGQSQTVTITIKPEMLMLFDENGQQVFQPGKFRLTAGSCSPGERGLVLGAAAPVSIEIEVP